MLGLPPPPHTHVGQLGVENTGLWNSFKQGTFRRPQHLISSPPALQALLGSSAKPVMLLQPQSQLCGSWGPGCVRRGLRQAQEIVQGFKQFTRPSTPEAPKKNTHGSTGKRGGWARARPVKSGPRPEMQAWFPLLKPPNPQPFVQSPSVDPTGVVTGQLCEGIKHSRSFQRLERVRVALHRSISWLKSPKLHVPTWDRDTNQGNLDLVCAQIPSSWGKSH